VVRYLLAFGVLVILPVAVVSLIFQQEFIGLVTERTRSQTSQFVDQTGNLIDTEIRDLTLRVAALVNDVSFLDSSSGYASSEDATELYRRTRELDRAAARFFRATDKVGSIYVIPETETPYYAFRNSPVTDYLEIIPPGAYAEAAGQPGLIHVVSHLRGLENRNVEEPRVTLALVPSPELKAPSVASFLFVFKIPAMSRIARNNGGLSDGAELYVLNSLGEIIFAGSDRFRTAAEAIGPRTASVEGLRQMEQAGVLAHWVPIVRGDWTLLHLQDANAVERLINRERVPLYIALALIVLGFVAYTLFFFEGVVSPLRHLSTRMREVETGKFDVSVDRHGPREILELSDSFNSMVRRIAVLTQETELKERARAEAEMQALQYQINPHFVSNTLSSIRLMALGSGATSIANVTGSLMRIVSDSFRTKEREIPLSRELENLTSYAFIMKVRFGESFTIEYKIPEEHRKHRIMKMLLQPIVENAIVHGIQPTGRKGHISVSSATDNGCLLLCVRDDGIGIDPQRIPEIITSPQISTVDGHRQIALYNVQRRIELHYGAGYGLEMRVPPEGGTVVTLRVPVIASGYEV
jgi:sensor histidine kinase YesM